MSTPNENPNDSENPIFEPFPEPQTMPSGWDLSDLTAGPTTAPDTQTTDDTEA